MPSAGSYEVIVAGIPVASWITVGALPFMPGFYNGNFTTKE